MKPSSCPEWFHHLMPRHRVILRQGIGDPGEAWNPTAIRSRIPEIWVDYPSPEKFTGRRRKLMVEADGKFVAIRSRIHPPIPDPASRNILTGYARDRLGRSVPVWEADRASRTIRVLVDFMRGPIVDNTFGIHPGEFLLKQIVEKPVTILLAGETKPFVGSRVRFQLTRLLCRTPFDSRKHLREELAYLRMLRPRNVTLPVPLSQHMQNIARRLEEDYPAPVPDKVPDELVDRQLSMLCRLVGKRACSELRLEDDKISGVVNPATDGRFQARAPLEFFLAIDAEFFRPCLYVSGYAPGKAQRRYPRCLGGGEMILLHHFRARDLYGMVDTVLNYIDTNRVGMYRRPTLPTGPPPVQGKLEIVRGTP